MKNLIFAAVFCMGFAESVMAQALEGYQYVRVPEKFDFLDGENQYQLNALTAFLFEKFGFTALYNEPTPEGMGPCDLLYADVHNDSGIFRSKLYVTLENCKDETVFTSKMGTSREKDFKTSFHEALRNAFESIDSLQHSFTGEIVIDPVVSVEERKNDEKPANEDSIPAEIIVDPVIGFEEREELKNSEKVPSEKTHAETYSNGAVSYQLKETLVGYDLFKSGKSEPFARLIKSVSGENYLYSSEKIGGNAFFDSEGNLIAEYIDFNSGQVISIIYRKDQ